MELLNVIKCEEDSGFLIWKHPSEDFNIGSQLIVHQSQEAIFFLNGVPLDLFGPGRHVLSTKNIPILSKMVNLPTNGVSPFHAEVYFINKKEQMAIKWGTDSKVQFIDPVFKFPLEIGACGEMILRVKDSRKLLVKIVGTSKTLSKEDISIYFKAFLMTHIKTYLAQMMAKKDMNLFEIDSKLDLLSSELKEKLAGDFEQYGISLEHFFVTTIVKPEDDPNFMRFKSLYFRKYADIVEANIEQQVGVINQETEAKKMVINAKALAEKRKTEGYTYQEQRKYDALEKMAQNEGVGEFASAGIGLGLISNIGGTVGKELSSAMSVITDKKGTKTRRSKKK